MTQDHSRNRGFAHILFSSKDEVDEIFKGVEVNSNGAMKYEAFVEHFMADPADEGEKK